MRKSRRVSPFPGRIIGASASLRARGLSQSVAVFTPEGRRRHPFFSRINSSDRGRRRVGGKTRAGQDDEKPERFSPAITPFSVCECVSADLDLPLVPHALYLFFSGQEMTPLPERSSPLDRKLIHTPECTEPGASSFLDEKEEEENLYFFSPRHTQLSLPTTVTYVFISEILPLFAGNSTSTLPQFCRGF